MRVRPYEPRDAAAVARVHRKSIRQVAAKDYSEEEIDAWASYTSKEPDIPEDKERFVAMNNDTVIGFAEYTDNEITGLYVHPGFTGEGVGTRLLHRVERDAAQHGHTYLKATVTVTAKPFYEDHDYAVLRQTTHSIDDQELTVYEVLKEL